MTHPKAIAFCWFFLGFKTVRPYLLIRKPLYYKINKQVVALILDFLTNRQQLADMEWTVENNQHWGPIGRHSLYHLHEWFSQLFLIYSINQICWWPQVQGSFLVKYQATHLCFCKLCILQKELSSVSQTQSKGAITPVWDYDHFDYLTSKITSQFTYTIVYYIGRLMSRLLVHLIVHHTVHVLLLLTLTLKIIS